MLKVQHFTRDFTDALPPRIPRILADIQRYGELVSASLLPNMRGSLYFQSAFKIDLSNLLLC